MQRAAASAIRRYQARVFRPRRMSTGIASLRRSSHATR
jgi:hypothetical protein